MPYVRKTLTQIIDGSLQDLAASRIFDGTTGQVVNPLLLQFDPLTIFAKMISGLAYEELGYIDYISLQATPATATDEAAQQWGAIVKTFLKPPTAASASGAWTGGVPTTDIPAGTLLVRTDGVTYTTTADVVVGGSGSFVLPFTASAPGALGTIAVGAVISLANSIAGIPDDGVVTSSTVPGADIETNDAFKARYLAAFAQPPNGGSDTDYEAWALAVPGVTRAWTKANAMGPGSVGIYIMLDLSEAGTNGFPVGTNGISPLDNNSAPRDPRIAAGDQLAVANAIIPYQPVTALVFVLAASEVAVPFTINNLGIANTETNQQAITAALKAMFVALGTPLGTTIFPSAWNTAIGSVVPQYSVPTPSAPIVLTIGQLPVLGPVTFNT